MHQQSVIEARRSALPVVAILSVLPWASSLYAQEAETSQSASHAAAADSVLAEVVVTARGREQPLQSVPVAVSVVSGEALARSNLTSLNDVAARLSNIKISSGTAVDQMYIRGVGSGQDPGFESAVATFSDGIYRGRSRSTRAALFDLDRIEVLKGPQTTFFGANAIAGALNITTRKPGTEFASNASALYAPEDGSYNFEGGVTVPLTSTVSTRVAARVSGSEGNIDNGPNGMGPNADDSQARASLRWEPNSDFRSDFRIDVAHSRSRNSFASELLNCPPPAPFVLTPGTTCGRAIAAAGGGPVDDRLDFHSDAPRTYVNYDFVEPVWTNSLQVAGGTLTSISGFFNHKYEALSQNIPASITGVVNNYEPFPTVIRETFRQLSQELRFASRASDGFEYMGGLYAAKSDLLAISQGGFFNNPIPANTPPEFGLPRDTTALTTHNELAQEDRMLAAFASVTLRLAPGLHASVAGRYASVRITAHHQSVFGTSVNDTLASFAPFPSQQIQQFFGTVRGVDIADFPNPTRTDGQFMPSAGLQYDLTDGLMAYATYSKGFKAGGYGLFTSTRVNEYGPETVNAYEAGIKGSRLGGKLDFSLDVFQSNYRDLQEGVILPAPSGAFVSAIRNVAQSRSQGVELNTQLRFTPEIALNTDLAYLSSEYQNYSGAQCTALAAFAAAGAPCTQDMSGKPRPYAPKYSGSVGLTVTVPMGERSFRADPLVYFSSSYFQNATADPFIEQKGYAKVDLRLAYGPSDLRWDIAVVGKNLTNKVTSALIQQLSGSPGSRLALTDAGRSIGLQLSIRQF